MVFRNHGPINLEILALIFLLCFFFVYNLVLYFDQDFKILDVPVIFRRHIELNRLLKFWPDFGLFGNLFCENETLPHSLMMNFVLYFLF